MGRNDPTCVLVFQLQVSCGTVPQTIGYFSKDNLLHPKKFFRFKTLADVEEEKSDFDIEEVEGTSTEIIHTPEETSTSLAQPFVFSQLLLSSFKFFSVNFQLTINTFLHKSTIREVTFKSFHALIINTLNATVINIFYVTVINTFSLYLPNMFL